MMLAARGASASDADTEKIAAWFFERYLLQSINLARFNAGQLSVDAGKAVEQEAPSLQRFLTKHRPAFVAALTPLIVTTIPAADIATVAAELSATEPRITPRSREWLVVIDEEFQKNEQRLLRAMAYELNVLVEQIVIAIRKTP